MKVMPPYCVALRACLPYCVPPTIRKVAQIVHADSHAADTSAPVACGYFSQEANASEPAPWHKESSGTMLSDALIDGRVGVKDISCLLDTQKEIVEELNQDPVTKFHSFHQYFGSRHF